MIDINAYRDEGPVVAGRGTPILVDNFNMKKSAVYSVAYYPTKETTGAPLVRPLTPGGVDVSFPVYTFFKLTGDGEEVKNLRIKLFIDDLPEASNVEVYYKKTNVYAEPAAVVDAGMSLLVNSSGVLQVTALTANLSPTGPHQATSSTKSFTLSASEPLYTDYIVTQLRAKQGSTIGNSAEVRMRFEVYEFGGI